LENYSDLTLSKIDTNSKQEDRQIFSTSSWYA